MNEASTRSLADHLRNAAQQHPQAIALIFQDEARSFAAWLNECSDPARHRSAAAMRQGVCGNALDLARHSVAASVQNCPFFPVDRSRLAFAAQCAEWQPAPETVLAIASSGSEGVPKIIMLGAAQLNAAAANAHQRFPLTVGDIWLNCLPLYHIGGQSILWRCARAGASVLLHDGFDVEAIAEDLHRHAVTHLSLVPAMLAALLDQGIAPPPQLKGVLIGGAALSAPLYRRAREQGWPLHVSYGMSESAAQLASHGPQDGPWHEGLVGHVMPGNEIAIDDTGRLRFRGSQRMLGYAGNTGLPDEAWFVTGDLGRIDPDGRLTILGRADDMLISGGRNVHPQEVESCLAALPGMRDVAVTGRPDPVWGDRVVALIVGNVSPETVIAHARQSLPSAAIPRQVVQLDRLPRNATGKLDRAALRQLAAGNPE